jgi:hypothetical protein
MDDDIASVAFAAPCNIVELWAVVLMFGLGYEVLGYKSSSGYPLRAGSGSRKGGLRGFFFSVTTIVHGDYDLQRRSRKRTHASTASTDAWNSEATT